LFELGSFIWSTYRVRLTFITFSALESALVEYATLSHQWIPLVYLVCLVSLQRERWQGYAKLFEFLDL